MQGSLIPPETSGPEVGGPFGKAPVVERVGYLRKQTRSFPSAQSTQPNAPPREPRCTGQGTEPALTPTHPKKTKKPPNVRYIIAALPTAAPLTVGGGVGWGGGWSKVQDAW